MSDIREVIAKKAEQIEKILVEELPEESGYAKTVYEAMNYSLMNGGKRLRPMLMQEMFYLYGGGDETVLHHYMAAIEMIHAYSLVHDDLPAMDDDDFRRGKPSTHKQFGEAMGILAGDALLNTAYEKIALSLHQVGTREIIGTIDRKVQMRCAVKAFERLSACAGVSGMVGGQVVDVENTGKEIDADTLLFIYRGKTSALISAAMMVGATLAGAPDQDIPLIERIGCDVGMAFQIRDDILDVCGEEKKIGKPIHSDEESGKNTYISIHGIEESEKAVREYTEQAILRLESLRLSTEGTKEKEFLRELFLEMAKRDH